MPFTDLPLESRAFRHALGLFATGVGLITVQAGARIHGMTANAISSLSLDPMLVLACVGKQARLGPLIEESGAFAINFLTRDQEPVARHFAGARPGTLPPEFHFEAWEGGPRLQGALGTLGCRLARRVEAGDHWIVIGEVVALARGSDAEPLVFYRGAYRRLTAPDEPAASAPDLLATTGASLYYPEWAGHPQREEEP